MFIKMGRLSRSRQPQTAMYQTWVTGSGIHTTSSAVSSLNMPTLNNTDGCELASMEITGTLTYDGSSTSISGGLGLYTAQTVTATGQIIHPFKTNRETNSASKIAFMKYSGSNGNTNLAREEHFNTRSLQNCFRQLCHSNKHNFFRERLELSRVHEQRNNT